MNPDKDKTALLLSDGWVLCESKSTPGRKYYFNRKTGKSSWTEPKASNESCSTQKNKSTSHLKIKRDKMHKKSLKRKSEGHIQEQNKKLKKDTAPQRNSTGTSKYNSPTKDIKTPTKQTPTKNRPQKQTISKNIANTRLSLLRSQLKAEVTKEDASSSETSKKRCIKNHMSPSQTHSKAVMPQKLPNSDLISPSSNDSRCSTNTQSPNESLNSHPSPSQFFTANKIISSMKAQLPDEYCSSRKQKDTFADIEKGISNQTTEYPYSKHPATPPQFSEASKLVSAIKSKLSYSPKDNIKMFTSAKERMENLRASLSEINESKDMDSSFLNCTKDSSFDSEAMEVEECKIIETIKVPHVKSISESDEQGVTIIVDTNIFIHELDLIKNVLNSHIKGYSEQPTLLVPWRVISELDRLKDNNNGSGAVCKRAKAAMDYLYKSLPENNRIKGQSLRDSNSHIYPCEVPDDEILNCCLQQVERGKSVILLSNDKNLCNKGTINGVRSKSLDDLKYLLESKPLPVVDPELGTTVKHCKESIYQLLANILENEMRAKYNNLWQHVVFKPPPWTLSDVLKCLLKHWIAVFNDVFPRIEQLITDLKNSLAAIENKDIKSISQFEVTNFKELCLDIAKRCQIIPEYMHLAKLTVARIERQESLAERAAETKAELVAETKAERVVETKAVRKETDSVIEAFENIWTVFSSYCSKLCERLGIDNNIEDKLEEFDDTLEILISKWTLFTEHTNTITLAMRGALSIECDDPRLSEHVARLQEAFTECLNVIGADPELVNEYKLAQFCIHHRNMLQEAHDKFTEVTELLLTCKNSISN